MRVFISWSGLPSKAIATALRDWIDTILPVRPWMSEEDIPRGVSWLDHLLTELEESNVGIICLTSTNTDAPFILFEAGALAKKRKEAFVCTYLYGEVETKLPLSIFQHTRFNKPQTLQMVRSINEALGRKKLASDLLVKKFNQGWPSLKRAIEKGIQQVNKAVKPPGHDGSRPVKWINVAGSGDDRKPFPKKIATVSRKVGRALAQYNLGIVTAGWPYVDEETTKAYIAERGKLKRPVEGFIKQVVRQDKSQRFEGGDVILVGSEFAVWARQVELADACVLISGEGGVLQTGLWFANAGKPVFPLAATGGDARKFYLAGAEKPFYFNENIPGVSKQDYDRLGNPLPRALDDLMTLLDKWANYTS